MLYVIYLLSGCSAEPDRVDVTMTQRLQLVFAPGIQSPLNITRVRVIIDGSQREAPPQEFDVESGATGVNLDLIIPSDAKRIRIEAFEPGNPNPVFAGESPVRLTGGSSVISARLDPTTTLVKFKSSKSEIHVGEIFNLDIEGKQLVNLFAITFEIAFDETLLEVIDVRPGDFWEGETLLIDDHDFAGRTPGRLNIGMTRAGVSEGLSESGIIAVARFRANQTGEARIRLLNNRNLSLQQPDGDPVPSFDDLTRFLTRADVSLSILP